MTAKRYFADQFGYVCIDGGSPPPVRPDTGMQLPEISESEAMRLMDQRRLTGNREQAEARAATRKAKQTRLAKAGVPDEQIEAILDVVSPR